MFIETNCFQYYVHICNYIQIGITNVMKEFQPSKVNIGEKNWGYTNVIDSLAARFDIPVMVINGQKDGPTFTVTGGLFPTEYCGVEAAGRIYQQVNPKELSGKLIIIPVVNMPVFQFRTPMFALVKSFSPMDGKDINTVFPGDPKGSISEVVAHKLFNDFILKSDYHVDLRGGELTESHLQHSIFLQIGAGIDKSLKEMGVVFGLRYCLPGRPDIPHTSPGTLIYEAVTCGVKSIISESGLGYNTQPKEDEVNGHVDGVFNLLKHFNMLKGKLKKPKHQNFLLADRPLVNAPVPGIFKTFADQGDLLKKDQVIGVICDLDTSELCKIYSPCDSVVHEMIPRRVVYYGDQLFRLAVVGKETGFNI